MKFAIVAFGFGDKVGAAAKRINGFSSALARKNISYEIFSDSFSLSGVDKENLIHFNEISKDLSRLNYLFEVTKRVNAKLKNKNFTHLICSGGPFWQFFIAYFLAKINNLKLILDYRDPWLGNPYNRPSAKFKALVPLFRIFELLIIKEARLVSSASFNIINFFSAKPKLYLEVRNGFDDYYLGDFNKFNYSCQDVYKIIYTGGVGGPHYPMKKIVNLIGSAAAIVGERHSKAKVLLNIYGYGCLEEIENIKKNNISEFLKISIGGFLSQESVVKEQISTPYALVIISSSENFHGSASYDLSTKVFEYIGAKSNIIAFVPNDGPCAKLINEYKAGIVIDPRLDINDASTVLAEYLLRCGPSGNGFVEIDDNVRMNCRRDINADLFVENIIKI